MSLNRRNSCEFRYNERRLELPEVSRVLLRAYGLVKHTLGREMRMGKVESAMLDYITRRLREGALAVCEAEVLDAVIPVDHPEYRQRPAYRYGLERLRRRRVINAVADRGGKMHYFIGPYASTELRRSLGL